MYIRIYGNIIINQIKTSHMCLRVMDLRSLKNVHTFKMYSYFTNQLPLTSCFIDKISPSITFAFKIIKQEFNT